jgi:hypothetical protein
MLERHDNLTSAMKTTDRYSAPEPTEAEIQHAAYLIWVEEGRPEGRELEHWMAAKELLRHRPSRAPKARQRVSERALPARAA